MENTFDDWYVCWDYHYPLNNWRWWYADIHVFWKFIKDLERLFYIFRKVQRVSPSEFHSVRWHVSATGE